MDCRQKPGWNLRWAVITHRYRASIDTAHPHFGPSMTLLSLRPIDTAHPQLKPLTAEPARYLLGDRHAHGRLAVQRQQQNTHTIGRTHKFPHLEATAATAANRAGTHTHTIGRTHKFPH